MKQIYLFFTLSICHFSFAQDVRLFEETWYLTALTSDGVEIPRPDSMELENVPLTFNLEPSTMETNACNWAIGSTSFPNTVSDFTLTDCMVTLGFCDDMGNFPFDGAYMSFFVESGLETNHFTYTITEAENGDRGLTINSMFNKQAVYSNVPLSTTQPRTMGFSIYPNPASDHIEVRLNDSQSGNAQIEIYDALGKLCKTAKMTTRQEQIGIEDLSGGIYLIKVVTENVTMTKKCIKL